jgi:GT2 family glycosyltransferase
LIPFTYIFAKVHLTKKLSSRPQRTVLDIGAVGAHFDFRKGELVRISNEELLDNELLSVSCVGGGMLPLIRSEVVRKGALPNREFFFCFEDLDFCLKVKKLGYKLIVPAEIMREMRVARGRWDLVLNKVSNMQPNRSLAWREYYAVRNMCFLFSHTYFDLFVLTRYIFKAIIKTMLGFRWGVYHGINRMQLTWLGVFHGIVCRLGKTIEPQRKKF